jgi:hypothetical protein
MSQLNAFPTLHIYSSQSSNSWCPVRHWNAQTVTQLAHGSDIDRELETKFDKIVYRLRRPDFWFYRYYLRDNFCCDHLLIHSKITKSRNIAYTYPFDLHIVSRDNINFQYVLNAGENVLTTQTLEKYIDGPNGKNGLVFWTMEHGTEEKKYTVFVDESSCFATAVQELKTRNKQLLEEAYPNKKCINTDEILDGDGGWSFKLVDKYHE